LVFLGFERVMPFLLHDYYTLSAPYLH
jgi:hypothetical protein